MRRSRDSVKRCARGRQWVSQRADGELSELERVLLAAHLRRCGPCRAVADDVRLLTRELRTASLERPARSLAPALPRRRRALRVAPAAALAAAAAVAAVAVGIGTLAAPRIARPQQAPTITPIAASVQAALRDEQRREVKRLLQARGDAAPEPISLLAPGRVSL